MTVRFLDKESTQPVKNKVNFVKPPSSEISDTNLFDVNVSNISTPIPISKPPKISKPEITTSPTGERFAETQYSSSLPPGVTPVIPESKVNILQRAKMSFGNTKGKREYLNDIYGQDNVKLITKDKFVIRKDNKWYAVDPKGTGLADLPGDITDVIGDIPEVVGFGIGTGVGAAATLPSGLGVPAGVGVGAGLGSAGGKVVQQIIGSIIGVYKPETTKEVINEQLKSAGWGTAGYYGFKLSGAAIKTIVRLVSKSPQFISGLSKSAVDRIMDKGVSKVITKDTMSSDFLPQVSKRAVAGLEDLVESTHKAYEKTMNKILASGERPPLTPDEYNIIKNGIETGFTGPKSKDYYKAVGLDKIQDVSKNRVKIGDRQYSFKNLNVNLGKAWNVFKNNLVKNHYLDLKGNLRNISLNDYDQRVIENFFKKFDGVNNETIIDFTDAKMMKEDLWRYGKQVSKVDDNLGGIVRQFYHDLNTQIINGVSRVSKPLGKELMNANKSYMEAESLKDLLASKFQIGPQLEKLGIEATPTSRLVSYASKSRTEDELLKRLDELVKPQYKFYEDLKNGMTAHEFMVTKSPFDMLRREVGEIGFRTFEKPYQLGKKIIQPVAHDISETLGFLKGKVPPGWTAKQPLVRSPGEYSKILGDTLKPFKNNKGEILLPDEIGKITTDDLLKYYEKNNPEELKAQVQRFVDSGAPMQRFLNKSWTWKELKNYLGELNTRIGKKSSVLFPKEK